MWINVQYRKTSLSTQGREIAYFIQGTPCKLSHLIFILSLIEKKTLYDAFCGKTFLLLALVRSMLLERMILPVKLIRSYFAMQGLSIFPWIRSHFITLPIICYNHFWLSLYCNLYCLVCIFSTIFIIWVWCNIFTF